MGAGASTQPVILFGPDNLPLQTESSNPARLVIAGPGTAGNPVGGVLTVQGITGGTPFSFVDFATAQAIAGRSLIVDPLTGAQTANYGPSAAPTPQPLSNTVPSYTTLGGLFQVAAVAGSEVDYALFAYQVPVGFHLVVTGASVATYLQGAQSSGAATVVQWAIGANGSQASLGGMPASAPILFPLGLQHAPKSASANELMAPGQVMYVPKTPIVIESQRYLHIIVRLPVANATPGLSLRGDVELDGFFF